MLLFSAGQRCGSTLVQRLLSSHPDVMIWGEQEGQLRQIFGAAERMIHLSDYDGAEARDAFVSGGYQSFMANLMPEGEWIDEALRQFVRVLFEDRAAAQGKRVWGIKEVRYGMPEARVLHRLFPGAVVIQLVRDPRDVLRSLYLWEHRYAWWDRRRTELAVRDWHRVAESFQHCSAELSPPVLRLRYEDVVADPAGASEQIGVHTELDPVKFDPNVFARKIHITGADGESQRPSVDWDSLPPSMRALLDDDDIRMVAAAYGYQL